MFACVLAACAALLRAASVSALNLSPLSPAENHAKLSLKGFGQLARMVQKQHAEQQDQTEDKEHNSKKQKVFVHSRRMMCSCVLLCSYLHSVTLFSICLRTAAP